MAFSKIKHESLMKGSSEYHEHIYCGPCSNSGVTAEAMGYCTECVENLCKVCMEYHPTFKVFLNHKVLCEPKKLVLCKPCSRENENAQSSGFCLDCEESLCPSCYDFHQRPSASRKHRLINKPDITTEEVKTMLAMNSVPKVVSGPRLTVPSLTAENIDMCVPCLTQNKQVDASLQCRECRENMCRECAQKHNKIKVFCGHSVYEPILNWCKPCARRMQRVHYYGYCNDCEEYICEKCYRYHQFASGLKKHQFSY